jgi:hypothetical protein
MTRAVQKSGSTRRAIDGSHSQELDAKGSGMDAALAYLISVGIIGFGCWIVATGTAGSGLFPIWLVLGILTIATGLTSLLGEIRKP